MWINFFKMNLVKATLTPELRSVVAQQEQETITIKRMYQVATTAQRELKGKGPALVNEVRDEEPTAESKTDDVAAFNRRGARPRNKPSRRIKPRKLQLRTRRIPIRIWPRSQQLRKQKQQ